MRTFLKSLLLAFTLQFAGTASAEPTKIAFRVVCDDQGAKEMISTAIRTRLEAAGLQITDKLPVKKLIVYAGRDVNDKYNNDGWSFAIAHASNQATFFVASKLLLPSDTSPSSDVKSALVGMLREEGFLTYLNVAHLDKLDIASISIVADSVVAEFKNRVPKEQPAGK